MVLASSSPRRHDLLRSLGLHFEIRPVDLDEARHEGEAAPSYVERLARSKAEAKAEAGELIVGADTVVVLDGAVLGKPLDRRQAREMLRQISGRPHRVLSGIAIHDASAEVTVAEVVETRVKMAPMSAEEVEWYGSTGEPDDKAGAYAIQGQGALFVEAIEGNYANVVGLPIPSLYRLLNRVGFDLREFQSAPPTPADRRADSTA